MSDACRRCQFKHDPGVCCPTMSDQECADLQVRWTRPQEPNPGPVRGDRETNDPDSLGDATAAPWPTNEALADYVRSIADQMRLRDWTLFVSDDPADDPKDEGIDDSRCATFAGTLGRRHANIWVNAEYWRGATPEERRQTIVHELIHAHEHGAREVVINAVSGYARRHAEILLAIYDVEAEYAIDTLAGVIAEGMPLPPEGA